MRPAHREKRALASAAAIALLALASCGPARPGGGAAPQLAKAKTGGSQATARDYPLVGVVRKVDRASGIVSIRHEAIPDFMPAMTMPFDLRKSPVLADLEPGDKVRGTLRVRGDDSELVDLEITEAATSPPGTEAPAAPQPLKPGETVPDFAVTTQDGKPLSLAELRGNVVVLTFIYTRCPLPNFCPLMDRKFASLARILETSPERAARVRLLSVSFDPEHDTPEVLARHAKTVGAAPPLWTFAVASHAELFKVATRLGLSYGPTPNEIIHNLSTAVIAPDGKLIRLERGNTWEPQALFKDIAAALRPARP